MSLPSVRLASRELGAGLCLLCLPWTAAPAADTNSLRPWTEYRTIMWIGDSASKRPEKLPLFYQRLREMGINTAMVYGGADPQPVVQAKFPYYVENLVNRGLCLKFNSQVTDWDKFVTDWARNGRSQAGLVRDYCLDDPQWLGWARNEVRLIATQNREHQPLAYNLRDELSTTLSANPFDYDFNPIALAAFRVWLKTQYADLDGLNAEWETGFKTWDEVRPFTTDQIKARMADGEASPRGQPDWQALEALRFNPDATRQSPTRWNFSPWADFRTYMDLSLARCLDQLRAAAHAIDPATPAGIEGTQMPHAFGGYDLGRLAQVLDWVEPYDIGNSREIFGSFMPGKPILTTVFEKDANHARRRLWHLLLEGDRGCIVWWSEDSIDWQSDDYRLTKKATALAPVLHEMTSPLARLFLRARRQYDPVYIHYSQPSIQADWLLESTVDGSTWLRRFSSFEGSHNSMLRVRDGWLKAVQDLGFSPRFVSSEQIERGALDHAANAVLVLPSSWALSDRELAAIQAGLTGSPARLSRVLFNGTPGVFDQHVHLRRSGPPALFTSASTNSQDVGCAIGKDGLSSPALDGAAAIDVAGYTLARLRQVGTGAGSEWLASQLGPLHPEISVPASQRVRIHRFETARGELVAFERNIDYQMSEDLKQAGGNEILEHPIEIKATLPRPMHVYELRPARYLGLVKEIHFTLDPWQPSLFALTSDKLPPGRIVDALSE